MKVTVIVPSETEQEKLQKSKTIIAILAVSMFVMCVATFSGPASREPPNPPAPPAHTAPTKPLHLYYA
jgi:hypothetical protein